MTTFFKKMGNSDAYPYPSFRRLKLGSQKFKTSLDYNPFPKTIFGLVFLEKFGLQNPQFWQGRGRQVVFVSHHWKG